MSPERRLRDEAGTGRLRPAMSTCPGTYAMWKRFRRMALGCAGVLALGLTAGPPSARAAELSGTVLSVDPAGKKMVVLDQQTSQNIDLGISDQAEIRTTNGKPLQLQDLKRGDRVGVLYNAGLATKVMVNQGELKG